MRCLSCKYDLSHLTGPSHRCPECGRAFDPGDVRTFAMGHRVTLRENIEAVLIVFALMVLTVVIFSYVSPRLPSFALDFLLKGLWIIACLTFLIVMGRRK